MKMALVTNDDFSMWHFWRGLICKLKSRHVELSVITPTGPYVSKFRSVGVKHFSAQVSRFVDPAGDVKFCIDLYRIFKTEKFDLVCNITVKPNVYGALMARLAGVQSVVGMVEGLGYGFDEGVDWKGRLLNYTVEKLYWLACTLSDRVGFANPDDHLRFVISGLVSKEKAVLFRSMVGVNLEEYDPESIGYERMHTLKSELGIDSDSIVVAMVVARIVWSKGVREFIEASEISKRWTRNVLFLLVGELDPDAKDAVELVYLRQNESPRFKWIGFRKDIRDIWAISDVAVLPSYYREGVPRALLEALGMGKPVVTTNNVGCREVVEEGKNGFLVPIQDSHALASAIETLASNDVKRRTFGHSSREKAKAEFDETAIINRIISELYRLDPCSSLS